MLQVSSNFCGFLSSCWTYCLQDGDEKDAKQLREQLEALRFKRKLKQLSTLQDFADAAIAVNDIRGEALLNHMPCLP